MSASSFQVSTGMERPSESGALPGLRLETDRFTVVETDRFLALRRES